jgi:hypothetical protein
MSFRPLLRASCLGLFCAVATAQEVAPPATPVPDAFPITPGSSPTPAPEAAPPPASAFRPPSGGVLPATASPAAAETPLMPDETPSLDKPEVGLAVPTKPKSEKEKKSKTEIFEQDLQQHIRLRQVRTQALADPAIVAQWDRSVAARTDAAKRNALKEYYKLLYERMLKIDASLKPLIVVQATNAQNRLTQARLTPTELEHTSDRSTSGRVFAE